MPGDTKPHIKNQLKSRLRLTDRFLELYELECLGLLRPLAFRFLLAKGLAF